MAAAKPPRVRTEVRTWQMPGYSAVADTTVFMDTLMLNYHDVDVQQNYSISSATNGNVLVSPIESRVVNDRLKTIDDPFAWSLTPYVTTPQQQRYYEPFYWQYQPKVKPGSGDGLPEFDRSLCQHGG